ncbi:cytoplasmic protein [Thiofaba sp. EF100]|uniref:cytoplasmic protein n=1 Tax=Thiofaba sp. EF100 TaxID=3121274 RepID=UPI003221CC55
MEKRIDAAIDIARAERETLRWIILSALWHGRPYGVNEHVLLMTAHDIPLRVTADQVRAEMAALEKRGLVSVGRDGPIWWAELTAAGEDVVDYRAACPDGIARPPRW